jgi:hypothetical protein
VVTAFNAVDVNGLLGKSAGHFIRSATGADGLRTFPIRCTRRLRHSAKRRTKGRYSKMSARHLNLGKHKHVIGYRSVLFEAIESGEASTTGM